MLAVDTVLAAVDLPMAATRRISRTSGLAWNAPHGGSYRVMPLMRLEARSLGAAATEERRGRYVVWSQERMTAAGRRWIARIRSMRNVRRARPKIGFHTSRPALHHTIVSLTFDDALAAQRLGARLLTARGLRGTFYVPSGFVGKAGYLTWTEIHQLAECGHEVGGHTAHHPHLTELTPEAARNEILRDRRTIASNGLEPVTFAYPFGESNDVVESFVRESGYCAARGVGGVVETLPPGNPYRLRTPHSARGRTTVEQLAALVLGAEHEEGWMIIPFHNLAPATSPSDYTTSLLDLSLFLDWLVARKVKVLPVRDVLERGR
jgi:peptidoglycan/xylan/chitin deacetylase (PgdA/CDA1 family)